MAERSYGKRPWTFYVLAALFTAFVIFLYAPMFVIYILSFQGPTGGLVFPMQGFSFTWFEALFGQARTGDVGGAFSRSLPLALIVLVLTVLISVTAGFAFRKRFRGSAFIFYTAIASLIVPGLVLSIGILVTFRFPGSPVQLPVSWYTSGARRASLMDAALRPPHHVRDPRPAQPAYEEAAYDLGASKWQALRFVVIPIVFPGMIAVALFGFTLSYDEFPRSWLTVGSKNTLPLEIWTMTTNVTSPALYALGTVTTIISFIAIALALGSIAYIQRKRSRRA